MSVTVEFDKDRLSRAAFNLAECAAAEQGVDPDFARILRAMVQSSFKMIGTARALGYEAINDEAEAAEKVGAELLKLAERPEVSDASKQAARSIYDCVVKRDPSKVLDATRGAIKKSDLPFLAKFASLEAMDSIKIKEAV